MKRLTEDPNGTPNPLRNCDGPKLVITIPLVTTIMKGLINDLRAKFDLIFAADKKKKIKNSYCSKNYISKNDL